MKEYSEELERELINFVNTKSRWNLSENLQLVPVRQTAVFLNVGQTVVFLNVGDVLTNKSRKKSGEKL